MVSLCLHTCSFHPQHHVVGSPDSIRSGDEAVVLRSASTRNRCLWSLRLELKARYHFPLGAPACQRLSLPLRLRCCSAPTHRLDGRLHPHHRLPPTTIQPQSTLRILRPYLPHREPPAPIREQPRNHFEKIRQPRPVSRSYPQKLSHDEISRPRMPRDHHLVGRAPHGIDRAQQGTTPGLSLIG